MAEAESMNADSDFQELLPHLHSVHYRNNMVLVSIVVQARKSEQHVVLRATNFEACDEVNDFQFFGWCAAGHDSAMYKRIW